MPRHNHDCSNWLHGQVIHALKNFQGNSYCGIFISKKLQAPASAWAGVTCEACLKTVTLCLPCAGIGQQEAYGLWTTCPACRGVGITASYVCHKDFCDDPRPLSEGMEQLYGRHDACMSDDLIEMIRQAELDALYAKEAAMAR